MHAIDFVIFGAYLACVLLVGFYFFLKNKNIDDYYVGGRSMSAGHVGLSVVATDVGGGFSIGLGGLGFVMGLSGSWLLFTGLVGAWCSAVLIIPKIKRIEEDHKLYTYPDFLRLRYGGTVAAVAALISSLGYMAFTGAQILAGAKLCAATLITQPQWGLPPLEFCLFVIAGVTILYTVLGGMKAVIYTDTVQWVILMAGLLFFGIPFAYIQVGGWANLRASLPPEFFSLRIDPVTFINWMATIVPIWLIAMTLYQRVFACKNVAEAKKAWYLAGIFEYPVMAFSGVFLGMCARVFFPEAEPEMGLPMLLKTVLPIGITGIVLASYFSAIMSTADSCLMASSGNLVNDLVKRYFAPGLKDKHEVILSQVFTFLIGMIALLIAAKSEKVLTLILHTYGFMVSGLFVPTLGAFFWKKSSPSGALAAMLVGGMTPILLRTKILALPSALAALGLDPSVYGLLVSAVVFISVSYWKPSLKKVLV